MSSKYLRYLMKTHKVTMGFFLIVYFVIMCLPYRYCGDYANALADAFGTSMILALVMSTVLAFALPVLLFAFVHRRSSADLYFSLPISRRQQAVTNLVFAYMQSFGYMVISAPLAWLVFGRSVCGFGRLLALLGIGGLTMAVLLTMNTVLFLLANNIFDGVVMMGAYTVLPWAFNFVAYVFQETMIAGYADNHSMLTGFGSWLSPLYLGGNSYVMVSSRLNHSLIGSVNVPELAAMAAIGLLAAYGIQKEFTERRTERAAQLSDSPAAYPFIISIYALSTLMIFACEVAKSGFGEMVYLYCLLLVIYIVATFVYRRKLSIQPRQLILFAAGALVTFGAAEAGWRTHGFGAGDQPVTTAKPYLIYTYWAGVSKDDLGTNTNDNDQWCTVRFTVAVPAADDAENREAREILESYRISTVSDYYRASDDVTDGRLQIYAGNTREMDRSSEEKWSISSRYLMSEADLVRLSRYGDVMVTDDNGDEIDIVRFLAERGN